MSSKIACRLVVVACLFLLIGRAACAAPVNVLPENARIIVIGGALTEIVHALDAGDQMIGRDTTSNYPESVLALPDVGYMRALSPEGVLSLKPQGLLLVEGSGPPQALEVLSQASLPMVVVPENFTAEGVVVKIETVAHALRRDKHGARLAMKVRHDFNQTATLLANVTEKKKVLFVLSLQNGRILAAGDGTAASGMIALAGGINAFVGKFSGYKLINDEELIAAAPDLILSMSNHGNQPLSEQLQALPAVQMTPAGKNGAIHHREGSFLLGFGPRTAQAAREVAGLLYDLPEDATAAAPPTER